MYVKKRRPLVSPYNEMTWVVRVSLRGVIVENRRGTPTMLSWREAYRGWRGERKLRNRPDLWGDVDGIG